MDLRIALPIVLCLALAGVPAFADYDNGPINGSVDAWTINFGFVVSDSFVTASNDFSVTGFMFGVWEFPGDTVTHVDWSITSAENSGTVYGSGTAGVTDKFISSNQYGYNIDKITVTGLNVAVTGNATYWLNLQNASVASGDPVYWDENSGKSKASESALGTIPSEAFTINTQGTLTCDGINCGTPEPTSFLLLGSGVLCLASLLRRKLF